MIKAMTAGAASGCGIDVGADCPLAWRVFSPYNMFELRHPLDRSIVCVSVEACWRGSMLRKGRLRPNRKVFSGVRGIKRVEGEAYAYWLGGRRYTKLESLARSCIYVPAYTLFVCKVVESDVEVQNLVRGAFLEEVIIYDSTGTMVFDRAQCLVSLLNGYISTHSHKGKVVKRRAKCKKQ